MSISSLKKRTVVERSRLCSWPAIQVDEALQLVDSYSRIGAIKDITIECAKTGDVLAEEVVATQPHPRVRTSIKDGYAVNVSDGVGMRRVIGSTTPSELATITLENRTVYRVNTGSMVPDGADAVVPVEETELIEHNGMEELVVKILQQMALGQNIRAIGSDVSVGEILLRKNTVLGPAEIGVLAASERRIIKIYEKAKVAIMSIGNELIDSTANDCPIGFIRDTNRPQLIALCNNSGAEAIDIGIIPDNEEKLLEAFKVAFSLADIVVSSGGVSMGEKDYVKHLLQNRLNFIIKFGRVMMKPGLPTTFAVGVWGNAEKCVFALPGNPVSSWVTANLFAIPAIKKMCGFLNYHHSTITVQLADTLELGNRPEFQRAYLEFRSTGLPVAKCVEGSQASSRILSIHGANLFLKLPAGSEYCSKLYKDDTVQALIIGKI